MEIFFLRKLQIDFFNSINYNVVIFTTPKMQQRLKKSSKRLVTAFLYIWSFSLCGNITRTPWRSRHSKTVNLNLFQFRTGNDALIWEILMKRLKVKRRMYDGVYCEVKHDPSELTSSRRKFFHVLLKKGSINSRKPFRKI